MTKVNDRQDSAESLAIDVLGWLAQDEDRISPFLHASGLAPGDLRAAAGDPSFLSAVLDHVMGDEPTLLACAQALAIKPERIAGAWQRLRPPEFDHTA